MVGALGMLGRWAGSARLRLRPERLQRLRVTPVMAALLLAGVATGVALWLVLSAEETARQRREAVPVIRVAIEAGEAGPAAADGAMATGDPGGVAGAGFGARGLSIGESGPMSAVAEAPVTLAEAPAPGLVEETPDGPLPRIGPDGSLPWRVYGRPFPGSDSRARVAVVIGDLGLRGSTTNMVLDRLPGEVSLAFVPIAERLVSWTETARRRGHEILLQLPMEPEGFPFSDPGPGALLVGLDSSRNLARLHEKLQMVSGYIGITTLSGSRFLRERSALLPVLESLKRRGLIFLDSGVGGRPGAAPLAAEAGVAWVRADVELDGSLSRADIDRQLGRLLEIARTNGAAVGIGRPYPATIERVAAWVRMLPGREVALVPVSAVVGRQTVPEAGPGATKG